MTKDERAEAIGRAMDSLEGLSCGDAFGENFFASGRFYEKEHGRALPPGEWPVTDDTLMAVSIVETLRRHGEILEEHLADHFVRLYEPLRGYGPAMHELMQRLGTRGGAVWQEEATTLFAGRGSFGNGSAMRVAPLGAYFATDLEQAVAQAKRSAHTTHAHAEASAGAIAVAVAAAISARFRDKAVPETRSFLKAVSEHVPESAVRDGILKAIGLADDTTAPMAGALLGNGARVTAMDTVPFTLWCAARWLGEFEEAMWQTVSAGGDMDTTCAIVGGIIGSRVGAEGIPLAWRQRREPLSGFFMSAARTQWMRPG